MVTQLHHYFLVTGLRRWRFTLCRSSRGVFIMGFFTHLLRQLLRLPLMDCLLYFIMYLLSHFGYSSLVLPSASLEHWLRQHYHHGLRHALGLVALVIFVLLGLGWSHFGLWATVLHMHRYFSTLAYSVGGAPSSSLTCLVWLILPIRWLLFADALVFH